MNNIPERWDYDYLIRQLRQSTDLGALAMALELADLMCGKREWATYVALDWQDIRTADWLRAEVIRALEGGTGE